MCSPTQVSSRKSRRTQKPRKQYNLLVAYLVKVEGMKGGISERGSLNITIFCYTENFNFIMWAGNIVAILEHLKSNVLINYGGIMLR